MQLITTGQEFFRLTLVQNSPEWLGTSGDLAHLLLSRVTYSMLPVSSCILSISKDGDSTTSLSNLLQCLTILQKVLSFLLLFKWNTLCFGLCPLFLAHPLNTTERRLAPSPLLPSYLSRIYKTSWAFSFSKLNSLVSLSLSLYNRCANLLITFLAPCWICFSMSVSFFVLGKPGQGLSGLPDGRDIFASIWLDGYCLFLAVLTPQGRNYVCKKHIPIVNYTHIADCSPAGSLCSSSWSLSPEGSRRKPLKLPCHWPSPPGHVVIQQFSS